MSQNDISDYRVACNLMIKSFEFTWTRSKIKLEDLISQCRSLLGSSDSNHIDSAYGTLADGLIPAILQYPAELPDTIISLRRKEAFFFQSITQGLTDVFKELFQAYLDSSGYSNDDDTITRLSDKFNTRNLNLRYPSQQTGPSCDWPQNKIDELQRIYRGIVDMSRLTRNLSIHMKDRKTKVYLTKVQRDISEPIFCTQSPGGFFIIISLVMITTHEFISILQTWVDTSKVTSIASQTPPPQ